jgi:hypothetical protein
MRQAYDAMSRDGGDDTADDDRVAVMVFISDEKGKEGAVQEQVSLLCHTSHVTRHTSYVIRHTSLGFSVGQ